VALQLCVGISCKAGCEIKQRLFTSTMVSIMVSGSEDDAFLELVRPLLRNAYTVTVHCAGENSKRAVKLGSVYSLPRWFFKMLSRSEEAISLQRRS